MDRDKDVNNICTVQYFMNTTFCLLFCDLFVFFSSVQDELAGKKCAETWKGVQNRALLSEVYEEFWVGNCNF